MATPGSNNAIVLERIDALRDDMAENTSTVKALASDYTKFREFYAGEHTKVVMQSEAAHRRLDDHDGRIKVLETAMNGMANQMQAIQTTLKYLLGVLTFLAITIGGYVIEYFWQVLTK